MTTAAATPSILVFSRTTDYRHDSIPGAIEVLRGNQGRLNVSFTFSEDQNLFTTDSLSRYDAILFLMMTGTNVLNSEQQAALKTYFQSGGVYIGVHSATAALENSTTYAQAAGAIFDYHPPIQDAAFTPLTKNHPATANFSDTWRYQEEVYYFRSDPRANDAVVLLTVDESSYVNNGTSTGSYTQGTPHPISWYIESPRSSQPLLSGAPKAGRSFYTSLGHLDSTWQSPTFQSHLFGGLSWALAGNSTRFYSVGLVGNTGSNSTTTGSSSSSSASSQSASASASASGSRTSSASASASGTGVPVTSSRSAADDSLRLRGGGSSMGVVWSGFVAVFTAVFVFGARKLGL